MENAYGCILGYNLHHLTFKFEECGVMCVHALCRAFDVAKKTKFTHNITNPFIQYENEV